MSPKNIDTEAIDEIATSASLVFTDDIKKAELTSSLGNMIDLFIKMDKIEVCPTKQSDFNKMTYDCLHIADTPCPPINKQSGQCFTHYDIDSGYFVVPKVINTES